MQILRLIKQLTSFTAFTHFEDIAKLQSDFQMLRTLKAREREMWFQFKAMK